MPTAVLTQKIGISGFGSIGVQGREPRLGDRRLVLFGAYPLITALLYLVIPVTAGWPNWQRTIVVASLMVAAMVYGVIPQVQRRCHRFLDPLVEGSAR